MPQFNANSESETIELARGLSQKIKSGTILLLRGPLGAGKTTFVRGLLQGLGSKNKAKSPTYTIMREYESSPGKILHLDLYRLSNYEEIAALGWPEISIDYFLTIIEWPERLENHFPKNARLVELSITGPQKRHISISNI